MTNEPQKLVTMKVKPGPHRKLATMATENGLGLSDALEEAVEAWEKASASNPKRARQSFDAKVTLLDKALGKPEHIIEAMTYVTDTLDVAWVAALDVFGKEATPQLALQIYDRMHARRLEIIEERRHGQEHNDATD
ncbi:hypothetical protein [Polyangium sp. y55x31]|uniref:hypothetical protein n=1 Tax=Polyangium sp. y55x31 TaxID=3042688 RepID=UPI0024822519|nr:hypothetical protein [Polyangium sp. y55x31]MDI1483588.1 hypothetical protein [Polyangium sp. y55x31]